MVLFIDRICKDKSKPAILIKHILIKHYPYKKVHKFA